MEFIFYDTETTGLSSAFDQILQFAAIKTDSDFNIIDSFEIRSKLLPYIIPSPQAMLITKTSAKELTNPNLPSHYEMTRSIYNKLSEWGTSTFIGWNSINFDEGFIRQALYKTLHSPYITSKNGNSKTDAMKIAQLCSMTSKKLAIPINDKNKKTFNLGAIAKENGFENHNSHNALGDVEATIFMCKLLKRKEEESWDAAIALSDKYKVEEYIKTTEIYLIHEFYGNSFSFVATTLGQSLTNNSEWYAYDLSVDPTKLINLSHQELKKRLEKQPKPIRKIKTNKFPIISPYKDKHPKITQTQTQTQTQAQTQTQTPTQTPTQEELECRLEFIQSNSNFRKKLILTMEEIKKDTKFISGKYIENQIFSGFYSSQDEEKMEEWHQETWENKLNIINKFQDKRLKEISERIIYLESPHILDKQVCDKHKKEITKRLIYKKTGCPWLTIDKALEEIDKLISNNINKKEKEIRNIKKELELELELELGLELEFLEDHKNLLLTKKEESKNI